MYTQDDFNITQVNGKVTKVEWKFYSSIYNCVFEVVDDIFIREVIHSQIDDIKLNIFREDYGDYSVAFVYIVLKYGNIIDVVNDRLEDIIDYINDVKGYEFVKVIVKDDME